MKASRFSVRRVQGPVEIRELFTTLYGPSRPKPDLVYGISNIDVLERQFPEHNASVGNSSRLAAGVPSRFIYTSARGKAYSGSDRMLHRESRFLPPEQLEPLGDITIIGDVVVFLTESHGTVEACAVADAAVARQMQGVFNLLWSQAW
jgi:hypothetical protein